MVKVYKAGYSAISDLVVSEIEANKEYSVRIPVSVYDLTKFNPNTRCKVMLEHLYLVPTSAPNVGIEIKLPNLGIPNSTMVYNDGAVSQCNYSIIATAQTYSNANAVKTLACTSQRLQPLYDYELEASVGTILNNSQMLVSFRTLIDDDTFLLADTDKLCIAFTFVVMDDIDAPY
jgi:hypothetical protein